MSTRVSGTTARTRIVVVGLNDRALATLKMLFAGADWKDCELIGTGKPDMAIVDLDTPAPDRTWDEFRARHPDLPALILSLRPQERSGARSLFKPISGESLRRAVNELKKDITVGGVGRRKDGASPAAAAATGAPASTAPSARRPRDATGLPPRASSFAPIPQRDADAPPPRATHAVAAALDPEVDERNCGATKDVDLESKAARAVVGYDPARFFQGLLEQAIAHVAKTGQSLEIRGLPAPFLILAGTRVRVSSAIRDGVLRSLCVLPLTRGSLVIAPLARAADDMPLVSAETMLWQVALWTARGRLRRDVAPDATVWFHRWPNFTRLAATPHAMRVAAMLVASPRPVSEVCRDLDIPQRYALSLVNAAMAIGVATAMESVPARVAAPRPVPAETGATRSVLARILGRLVPGGGT